MFAKLPSATAMQRTFCARHKKPPTCHTNIYRWYKRMEQEGCIYNGKSTCWPSFTEAAVNGVRVTFQRSPKKSARRGSREQGLPQSMVWRIRRRSETRLYRLYLLQARKEDDKVKRFKFCCRIKSHIENYDDFVNRLTFSDESTFHLNGKVNRHNVRTWESETPHVVIEHETDSPKVNVFCAISRTCVFGPFFLAESTVTGTTYLDMLTE